MAAVAVAGLPVWPQARASGIGALPGAAWALPEIAWSTTVERGRW
jgi:hypothetical protein